MDKNQFIDEYLNGKRPIEQEKWELPSESELDQDEALFDALLAQNQKAPLLARRFRTALPQCLLQPLHSSHGGTSSLKASPNSPKRKKCLSSRKTPLRSSKNFTRVNRKVHTRSRPTSHEKFAKFTREV